MDSEKSIWGECAAEICEFLDIDGHEEDIALIIARRFPLRPRSLLARAASSPKKGEEGALSCNVCKSTNDVAEYARRDDPAVTVSLCNDCYGFLYHPHFCYDTRREQ
jgi:hypothetical protein